MKNKGKCVVLALLVVVVVVVVVVLLGGGVDLERLGVVGRQPDHLHHKGSCGYGTLAANIQ